MGQDYLRHCKVRRTQHIFSFMGTFWMLCLNELSGVFGAVFLKCQHFSFCPNHPKWLKYLKRALNGFCGVEDAVLRVLKAVCGLWSQMALLSLRINCVLSVSYFAEHLRHLRPACLVQVLLPKLLEKLVVHNTALGSATVASQAVPLRNGLEQRTWMPLVCLRS